MYLRPIRSFKIGVCLPHPPDSTKEIGIVKNMKDIYKATKSSNVNCIYDQSDPRVAQRVRSKRRDERNSTASPRQRQTSWNLVGVRKMMRARHPQGGGVGGCSSGVVCENHLVHSEFSEGMRTHAGTHTLFKYPLGKPSEGRLLKEIGY